MPSKKGTFKVLGTALDILQIAFAVLVTALVSWRLLNVDVEGTNVDSNCLLDGSVEPGLLPGSQFCIYAIAVGIISLLVSVIFGCIAKVFSCVTLNLCKANKIVDVVADIALGAWWTVAFVLFVRRGTDANEMGFPETPARNGVIAAAFGAMASFYTSAILTVCDAVL